MREVEGGGEGWREDQKVRVGDVGFAGEELGEYYVQA